jgi:hypothetical protein
MSPFIPPYAARHNRALINAAYTKTCPHSNRCEPPVPARLSRGGTKPAASCPWDATKQANLILAQGVQLIESRQARKDRGERVSNVDGCDVVNMHSAYQVLRGQAYSAGPFRHTR